MSTLIQNVQLQLSTVNCCLCGVTFAMTAEMNQNRLGDKKTFWCPNGHSQHYLGKSDKQVAAETTEALTRTRAQLDQAQAAARAAKVAATNAQIRLNKAKKRANAALCPVQGCARSFVQLKRHLDTKHPDYVKEHPHGGVPTP